MAQLRLVGANLNYSSWTWRAWLALKRAGAEFRLHDVGLKTTPDWKDRILAFSGAGKVPVLIDGSLSVHESLAICEYVAERFPESGLWPNDVALRARGRAISCEMLSGFSALRSGMPANLRARSAHTPSGTALEADIARVFEIWEASLATSSGEFLLGDFSIADCMYFPVATRFRTYGVTLPERSLRYSQALFARPEVVELEALARQAPAIAEYDAALTPH
jgi:glutathione S-transferase